MRKVLWCLIIFFLPPHFHPPLYAKTNKYSNKNNWYLLQSQLYLLFCFIFIFFCWVEQQFEISHRNLFVNNFGDIWWFLSSLPFIPFLRKTQQKKKKFCPIYTKLFGVKGTFSWCWMMYNISLRKISLWIFLSDIQKY